MADPLATTFVIAARGMQAQTVRMRVVSENLANAQSTGEAPGADAYRRKVVTFAAAYDRAAGADLVSVSGVEADETPFQVVRQPGHPAADENGLVKMPNVNPLIELADMREANRGFEANLEVMKQARSMTLRLIDLMRNSG